MITALMLTSLFLSALIFLGLLCYHVKTTRAKSAKDAADQAATTFNQKLELVMTRMRRTPTFSGSFSSKSSRSSIDQDAEEQSRHQMSLTETSATKNSTTENALYMNPLNELSRRDISSP